MSELRPGCDSVMQHTPGSDVPAPASRVLHSRPTHVRTERGVSIANGVDADGRLTWLLSATHPDTGHLSQAWVFDRRALQAFIDQFASSLARLA